jgi:uncharacterized membrane protein YqaE (UPF0057 family)
MKRKIIVAVLFTLALQFNVIAAEKVVNEKKTAESVFAIAKQMETFDADVLKAEMKGLSMSERAKLVKMAIKDAKAEQAANVAGKPGAGLYVLAILIPPVAVGIHTGWKKPTLFNLLWTFLFGVPGIIHAFIVLGR